MKFSGISLHSPQGLPVQADTWVEVQGAWEGVLPQNGHHATGLRKAMHKKCNKQDILPRFLAIARG
ncbi:MAG: hypothetical protein OHK0029_12770 [Armatimonadaceae bacterium]